MKRPIPILFIFRCLCLARWRFPLHRVGSAITSILARTSVTDPEPEPELDLQQANQRECRLGL